SEIVESYGPPRGHRVPRSRILPGGHGGGRGRGRGQGHGQGRGQGRGGGRNGGGGGGDNLGVAAEFVAGEGGLVGSVRAVGEAERADAGEGAGELEVL